MYHSVQTKKKKFGRRKIVVNKSQANYQRFAKFKATKKKKKTIKGKKNLPLLVIPDETAAVGDCDKPTEPLTLENPSRNSQLKLNETKHPPKSNANIKNVTSGNAEECHTLNSSSLSEGKHFHDKNLENYKSSEVFVIDLEEGTATESIQILNMQESCSASVDTKLNRRRSFISEGTYESQTESNKGVKRKKCTDLENTPNLKDQFQKRTPGLKKKKNPKMKNKRPKNIVVSSPTEANSINEADSVTQDETLPFSECSFSLTDEEGEEKSDFNSTWENENEASDKAGFDGTFEESDDPRSGISDQAETSFLNSKDNNDALGSPNVEKYKRKRKLFCTNQNVVLLLEHPSEIAVRGCTTLRVLYGCVEVAGVVLRETSVPVPIISPASQSAPVIKTTPATGRIKTSSQLSRELIELDLNLSQLEDVHEFLKGDECTILLFQEYKHPISKCLSSYMPTLFKYQERKVLSCDLPWCAFVNPNERTVVNIPQDWYDIADIFCQLAENFKVNNEETNAFLGTSQAFSSVKNHSNKLVRNLRILVCGGKNCGKSTFLRFLANSLLHVSKDVVYYLDGDPGQSEFTIPGCVSIAEIKKPLLGPSFSHQKKLIKSHFVGGVSVYGAPDLYSKSIKSLADFINSTSCFDGKPLLINTMGWITSMGRALLLDTVRFLQPMFIIQINQLERANFKETEYFTTEFLEKQPGWMTNIEMPVPDLDLLVLENVLSFNKFQFSAAQLRNIAIIAYFAQLYKSCDISQPFQGFTPYRVPWSAVGVYVSNECVPNHEILYSLNASIVALCICDPSLLKTSSDSSLPKFLLSLPVCDCVGFGIIRGINVQQKEFYVITPVAHEELMNVNLFLKGSLTIPEQMILNQKSEGGLPYVTEVPYEQTVVGGRTTKKRKLYNVKSALD